MKALIPSRSPALFLIFHRASSRLRRSSAFKHSDSINSVALGMMEGESRIFHPRSAIVLFTQIGIIALLLALIPSISLEACNAIKWLISLSLLFTSGYYGQPRRKIFLQPDYDPYSRYPPTGDITLSQAAREDGYFELDTLERKSLKWNVTKTKAHPQKSDPEIENVPVPLEHPMAREDFQAYPPISLGVASVQLLAALLFNPVIFSGLSKTNWIIVNLTRRCLRPGEM